jgi:hypothetical protein
MENGGEFLCPLAKGSVEINVARALSIDDPANGRLRVGVQSKVAIVQNKHWANLFTASAQFDVPLTWERFLQAIDLELTGDNSPLTVVHFLMGNQ